MADITVNSMPPYNQFTVLSDDSIRYASTIFKGVTSVTMLDGTVKTCAQILQEAGGVAYADGELKKCVRVEGYDPNSSDRGIFTVYSNNSRQTTKNETSSVPGQLWIEMFDFEGDGSKNPIVHMWDVAGLSNRYERRWVGFKINWGSTGKRSYVITHVNDFGEESMPCPPATIDTTYMHVVRMQGVFRATFNRVPIRNFNVYRTTIGTDNTFVYRRVPIYPIGIQYGLNTPPPEFPPHQRFPHSIYVAYPGPPFAYAPFGFNIDDDTPDKDVTQDVLESADWDPPPLPCRGLTAGWNGMLFAHWENTLFPFEPYRPFTAPAKYRIAFPHKINATIVDGNSLVVLTNGPAYMVTGAHPSQLTYEQLQHTQASKEADPIYGIRPPSRSVCKTPFGIAYISDEGISLEAGGRSSNMTDKHFDKITWQQRFRASFGKLRLAYSNEKVLVFTKDDPGPISMMISNESGQMATLVGYAVRNTFALPGSDGLFIITGQGNTPSSLWRFEDHLSRRVHALWKSKRFIFPKPVSFGCCQIAGRGQVIISIYADGDFWYQITTELTGGSQILRLPTGKRSRKWEVVLDALLDSQVVEFYLANTPLELQSA